jgi:hypothetical protein
MSEAQTEAPDETEAPAVDPDEEAQEAEEAGVVPDEGDETGNEATAGGADLVEESQGPQPPSLEKQKAGQDAWDRERDRHMRELEKRDEWHYSRSEVCPFCQGHGLIDSPETPEEATLMRQAFLAIVGLPQDAELHPHPRFKRCETCEGYGKVYTGSRVAGQEALNCPDCNGQGHTGGATQAIPTPLPVAAVPQVGPPPHEEQERIGNDAWGRPPGHPHYGLLPAQVS